MNDCATGIHNCDVNGICINQIGSFSCRCSDLYRDVSDEFGHKCKGIELNRFSRPRERSLSVVFDRRAAEMAKLKQTF